MKKRGSTLESSSSTDRSDPDPSGEPDSQVVVGRLGKPNGLDGFMGLYVDEPNLSLFVPGSVVSVAGAEYTVREVRRGKKGPQVAFEEIRDRAQAEQIRGNDVLVPQPRQLSEGEYWPSDLIGLRVEPGGGTVVGVNHGPAQDRLVIERDGERFEVPFVDELVPTVDLGSGFVEVVELPGLTESSDRG